MIKYLKKYQKLLFRAFLGVATCFFIVNIAAPSQSMSPTTDFVDMHLMADQTSLTNHQQQAKSVLMAQGTSVSQRPDLKTFGAFLSGNDVFPLRVSTPSIGAVGAALEGNRLVVRGSFRDLSSAPRDYATDPLVPPNPSVTSAAHIHRGTATENGPFQYALEVQLESSGLSGNVKGDYTLTDEQLQALNSGRLYVDLHTKGFRGGELRGILKPYRAL